MLKKLIFALVAVSITSTALAVVWYVKSWQDLPFKTHVTIMDFEASGAVFDPSEGKLFLVDDSGKIASSFIQDGEAWPLAFESVGSNPDLEAVATTSDGYIYVGVEGGGKCVAGVAIIDKKPSIVELRSSDMEETGKSWKLPGVPAKCKKGMEGLTWVPNGAHPYGSKLSGGVFYASSQKDGYVYIMHVNRYSSGSTPTSLGFFKPLDGQTDISDLYYDPIQKILFVLYDVANRLVQVDISTTANKVISNGRLPSSPTDQEGVTFLPSCGALSNGTSTIYLADDTLNNGYYSYDGFHGACPSNPNKAEFVSYSSIPDLTPGQIYPMTITMRNTGTTTWTGNTFQLHPTEGKSNSSRAIGSSTSVPPSYFHTFNINVTAPSTIGKSYLQWRMKEGSKWFGTVTPRISFNVYDDSPPPPICRDFPCEEIK